MNTLLSDLLFELGRHKSLAERALAQMGDREFFQRPAEQVNSAAIIVKHIAGNLVSRWTDFLTTDGEKPNRNRDGEFLIREQDTRSSLMESWEQGWQILFATVRSLQPSDLDRSVMIRQEAHSARQALLRGLTHIAYHTGQILYLVRLFQPDSEWLTVRPAGSRGLDGTYRGI